MFMSRRTALTTGGLALLAASGVLGRRRSLAAGPALEGEFTLPALPYALDALEPHIDAKTMEIHHGKHHQAYVTNLNTALKDQPDQKGKSIEDLLKGVASLPESIRTAVRNNGGGHYNHSLFWTVMKADGGGEPKGALGEAIAKDLGGLRRVQGRFQQSRRDSLRLRLGLARQKRRRKAVRDLDAEPGQPAHGRVRDSAARPRCLGACLLPQVSEPSAGLHRRLVEHSELGRGRPSLPRGPVLRSRRSSTNVSAVKIEAHLERRAGCALHCEEQLA